MEKDEFQKFRITNRTCYYYNDIVKLEDCDIDNIVIDKKSHEDILTCNISYKTLIDQNFRALDSIKLIDLLEFMMELNI